MCDHISFKRGVNCQVIYWFLLLPLLLLACAPQKNAPVIWYVSRQSGIETLNPTTLERHTLIPLESGTSIDSADLSPDGKHLAYRKYQPEGYATWLANADGSDPIRVTSFFTLTGDAWLTDRSLIVMGVNSYGLSPEQGQVGLYDLTTRQTRPITVQDGPFDCGGWNKYDSGVVWVPIVTDTFVGMGHLELDGNVLRPLPDIRFNLSSWPGERSGCYQSWTPHMAQIAFEGSTDNSDVEDLFLATQQGQTVTRLTDWGKDYKQALLGLYAISPDGRWIVLNLLSLVPRTGNSLGSTELALLSADGKTLQFLGRYRTEYPMIWSPDSRAAVMSLSRTDIDISNTFTELYVLNPETRELKQLTTDGETKEVFAWQ